MTQAEAIKELERILGNRIEDNYSLGGFDYTKCSGHIATCPIDECMLCSVRDCPDNEPLHYHHDGCPICNSDRRNAS